MNYSDFAIEQLKGRLQEKAFNNSTPKKYAGDMLEALEVIQQLQKPPGEWPRKNEPLTLEELREMQGYPVWVVDQGGNGILVCGIVYNNAIIFANGSCVWLDENAGNVACGSWWLAYRHKPKEESK